MRRKRHEARVASLVMLAMLPVALAAVLPAPVLAEPEPGTPVLRPSLSPPATAGRWDPSRQGRTKINPN